MKVLIACDSFKGSMTSNEVNDACERGIREVIHDCEIIKIPIADGGEGTVLSLTNALEGKLEKVIVHDPYMNLIEATYGRINKTAIIEMASSSGLTLVPKDKRNPLYTTTYGLGEVIIDAIKKRCSKFIIGIGGSATNDGGLGMLQALGIKFFNNHNEELKPIGKSLIELYKIDASQKLKTLNECEFTVLCDVSNPLYGKNGASYVYARQKGANDEEIEFLDKGLKNYAEVVKNQLGIDLSNLKGAGAAGGLGAGIYAFLNGKLSNGIEAILKLVKIEEKIKDVDFIITGEGAIDSQSIMGKAVSGIANLGKRNNVPVIAIGGALLNESEKLHDSGITSLFSIMNKPMSVEEAMDKDHASKLVVHKISEIFRLIKKMY